MLHVLLQTQRGLNYYSLHEISLCFYLSRKHVALYRSFDEPILRRKACEDAPEARALAPITLALRLVQTFWICPDETVAAAGQRFI